MKDRNQPIIVEQLIDSSVSDIWKAITELDQMKKWYFEDIPSFEPVVGFQTSFSVHPSERTFTFLWKVLEVIPNKRIKYEWTYEEYDGAGFVTFDLLVKNDKTLVRLTNEGLSSFPEEIPEFSRASCEGGWDFFIRKNLKEYMNGEAFK